MVDLNEIKSKLDKINPLYRKIDSFISSQLEVDVSYADIILGIEKIINESSSIAFPVNFSVNNVAAHDTLMENDTRRLNEGDVVKIDVGIHVDGFIIDSAKTYIVGNNDIGEELKKACEIALKEVISSLRCGIEIKEIGSIVENVAERYGFGIVSNLTGHNIEQYKIHGSYSIPNVKNNIEGEISYGDLIAIEPFLSSTPHNIVVKDSARIEIYELNNDNIQIRDKYAKLLLKEIKEYERLPFASRWLTSLKGFIKKRSLFELMQKGIINGYPVLYHPNSNILIAQAEYTVLMLDKPVVYGFTF